MYAYAQKNRVPHVRSGGPNKKYASAMQLPHPFSSLSKDKINKNPTSLRFLMVIQ